MSIEYYPEHKAPEHAPDFTDPFIIAAISRQLGLKVPDQVIDQCLEKLGFTREDLNQVNNTLDS